jgi:predicted nuclease with RNAse H fold
MKILNVNALLGPVTGGGTAERTLQISRALMNEGVDVIHETFAQLRLKNRVLFEHKIHLSN